MDLEAEWGIADNFYLVEVYCTDKDENGDREWSLYFPMIDEEVEIGWASAYFFYARDLMLLCQEYVDRVHFDDSFGEEHCEHDQWYFLKTASKLQTIKELFGPDHSAAAGIYVDKPSVWLSHDRYTYILSQIAEIFTMLCEKKGIEMEAPNGEETDGGEDLDSQE